MSNNSEHFRSSSSSASSQGLQGSPKIPFPSPFLHSIIQNGTLINKNIINIESENEILASEDDEEIEEIFENLLKHQQKIFNLRME